MKTNIPPKRQPLIDTFIHRNSQINLSAIRTPEDIYIKHILDSLELTKIFDLKSDNPSDVPPVKGSSSPKQNKGELEGLLTYKSNKKEGKRMWRHDNLTLLDLWTWWGFPLLPLAITYPDIHCIWLDARKKKCHAITEMVKTLWLENVITARSRAEEYDVQVDIVTSRAVTYADKLIHRSLPLIKPGGYLIMYKLFTPEEDNTILSLIKQHKLTLKKLHHYQLPNDKTQRVIYILQK